MFGYYVQPLSANGWAIFLRTAKTLIRLGRCPGWSQSTLGANAILLVLSWGVSNEACHEKRDISLVWLVALKTPMLSHPVGPDLRPSVWSFLSFPLKITDGADVQVRSGYVKNTIFIWDGSKGSLNHLQYFSKILFLLLLSTSYE